MNNKTNETNENINKLFNKPRDIICPECGENAFIKIDNYRIKLFGCKNEHIIDNILLSEFDDCQYEGLSKIKSQDSNIKIKTNQKLCNDSNMNLCDESIHKNNNNSNYCINNNLDSMNQNKRNNLYSCKTCKMILCSYCQNNHKKKKHEILEYNNILYQKDYLRELLEQIKYQKNELIKIINKIQEKQKQENQKQENQKEDILNNVKNNIDIFYSIHSDIFKNYNYNKYNYTIIENINEIIKNSEIKDITHLINENNIENQFKIITGIYQKMNEMGKDEKRWQKRPLPESSNNESNNQSNNNLNVKRETKDKNIDKEDNVNSILLYCKFVTNEFLSLLGGDTKIFKNMFGSNDNCNESDKPKGLYNLGLNCYMNSLLQCLFYIRELRNFFIKYIKYFNDKPVCRAFAKVMYGLKNTREKYFEASDLKKIMGKKNGLFRGIKAGDAKDLFFNLIDSFLEELQLKKEDDDYENVKSDANVIDRKLLYEETKRETDKNIINRLFLGYYEIVYQCKNSEKDKIYSFTSESFILFNLGKIMEHCHKNVFTIEDCFAYNFKRKYNTDFYCSNCNKIENNNAEEIIYKPPLILVLILDRGHGKQFAGIVKFEKELDIKNYMDDDSENNQYNTKYNLIGVCTHSGTSSSSGHYTACCLTDNNEYYYFSDTYVRKANEEDLYKDDPYLLFYRRKRNDN